MSRFARWFPPIVAPALLVACADDSGGGVKGAEMPVLSVKSTAFEPGGTIPTKHTCDGEDIDHGPLHAPEALSAGAARGTAAAARHAAG